MASRKEAIVARVAALLLENATGPNATGVGQAVYRDRVQAFAREDTPAVVVEFTDEESRNMGGNSNRGYQNVDHDRMRFTLAVCVRSENWQSVADSVLNVCHRLLMADQALTDLCADLRRDRCESQAANTDVPFGYYGQIYQCQYATLSRDLEVAP